MVAWVTEQLNGAMPVAGLSTTGGSGTGGAVVETLRQASMQQTQSEEKNGDGDEQLMHVQKLKTLMMKKLASRRYLKEREAVLTLREQAQTGLEYHLRCRGRGESRSSSSPSSTKRTRTQGPGGRARG